MKNIYRVYLRDFNGNVPDYTKTQTVNSAAATEAFAALVNRGDLDGQKLAAVLSYNNVQVAFHRFDRLPGQADYWRDRLDEIEWPTARPAMGRGGARTGAGVKPDITDGGPINRITVTVDRLTHEILKRYGGGNFSKGIRRAARAITP